MMEECDIFEEGSRQWLICRGEADLSQQHTNRYRKKWGLPTLFDESQQSTAAVPVYVPEPTFVFHGESVSEPGKRRVAYGPGAELLKAYAAAGAPHCAACVELAEQMNEWGPAGCRKRLEEIVLDILPRAKIWLAEKSPWIMSLIPDAVEDFAICIKLRMDVTKAIDIAEKSIAERKHQREDRVRTHVSNGNKHMGGCCGSSPSTTKTVPRRIKSIPFTPLQKRMWERVQKSAAPSPDPFTAEPTIHFAAHLWPSCGACWRWHVERWNEIAGMIGGRCIIGLATVDDRVAMDDVRAMLSSRFEIIERPNTMDGETNSFRVFQEMLPGGENDVLIYCHGKGVRPHTRDSEPVRLWSEIMYETVVFNHREVIKKLADGYKMFGSFRTFGNVPLHPTNNWHYSGTFWAIRAKHLANKPVKPGYGGVEAWPGDHFSPEHCWTEFADNSRMIAQYDIDEMYPRIVNDAFEWEVNRVGGVRCEQHLRELDWFASRLRPGDHVLVIGSRNGGLEPQLRQRVTGLTTVSIDVAPQPDNAESIIVGSSADAAVQAAAADRGPFDVVFIDGDHSYAGAKLDFAFARSLSPRLIALHDIADAIKHRREGCEVDRVWAEIKVDFRAKTEEKIVGMGWGGIGVVST